MKDIYEITDNFENYQEVCSLQLIEGRIENPEISIFVPTYKRASTLEVTIDSILKQKTSVRYEIVVINNDSKDCETRKLLEKKNDTRIYYYVNEKNIGLCGNWNRGIELSRAKYVSMIHDDDILSPYFVESIKKAIEENNYPGIIGVDYYTFCSTKIPVFEKPNKLTYRQISKESFFFGVYINIAGMTVKKSLIREIGGYSEEYYPNEDTNLIYQGILKDSVINVNYPLAGYRKEYNLSLDEMVMKKIITVMEKTRRNIAEHEMFAQKWLKKYDKEFLFDYINNANNTWKLSLKSKDIFCEFGLSETDVSKIKLYLMRLKLKMLRRRFI